MRESHYQAMIKQRIGRRLPGAFVIKLSTDFVQGLPDLLVLFGERWAVLEVKASATEPYRPNQEYYLRLFAEMSFAATICPENEEEVLDELLKALQS
jgi:hypothetical protein